MQSFTNLNHSETWWLKIMLDPSFSHSLLVGLQFHGNHTLVLHGQLQKRRLLIQNYRIQKWPNKHIWNMATCLGKVSSTFGTIQYWG
jgi:hypothetical protein